MWVWVPAITEREVIKAIKFKLKECWGITEVENIKYANGNSFPSRGGFKVQTFFEYKGEKI